MPALRTAPAPCDGVVVPSLELSLKGDATAAGAKALRVASMSVEKNSVRISTDFNFLDVPSFRREEFLREKSSKNPLRESS